jgi:peroxiredoxin
MNAVFLAMLSGEFGLAIKHVSAIAGTPVIGLAAVQWITLAMGVVVVLGIGVLSWLLVHLLGQNGRLLVRLEQIESALEDADIEFDLEAEAGEEIAGLPIGSPAPEFSLSRLSGKTESLERLLTARRPVLLIFSDPACVPCNALMPEIDAWAREQQELLFAVISRGSLEANRQKFSQYNAVQVMVQDGSDVSAQYQVTGTPTAILVQPDGTIGSGLAAGADNIRALVQRARRRQVALKRKQAAAAPVRGAERIGKDAPLVELKNLDGGTVRLADFAGQPTAVLFWNPDCGYCQRMVDDLKAWEANPPRNAPQLLVVSTGDVAKNREVGLTSPTVLDSGFTVGTSFGASGTPSAVLVGADGKVASGLAVGGSSVMSLLQNKAPHLLNASNAAAEPAAPAAPAAPRGLSIGSTAPSVALPDLEGRTVKLDDIRHGRTALLFWNPGCGFCQRLEPELKAWEASRGTDAPQLVVVSTGTAEANRAHGFTSTILLDQGFQTASAFGASGTPSAVLLDEDGKVASSVAVGGPNVMNLLQS